MGQCGHAIKRPAHDPRGVLKIREPVREPFGGGSVPRVVLEEGKSALLAQGGGQGTMSDSCPSWLRYRSRFGSLRYCGAQGSSQGTMADLCHSPPGTGRAQCQIRVLRGGPTEADSVTFGSMR